MCMENLGKIPPHSMEAEQSVLGAMILDREAIVAGTEILRSSDFYTEAHKEIYEAITDIFARDEPVDLITLSEELKKRNTLESIGGIMYIANLSEGVSTTANIRYYCEIVEEKSILRKLIKASNEIISKGYEDEEKIENIMELAEKSIFDITQKRNQEGLEPIKTILLDSFTRIEELSQSKGGITGLTTGFIDLDNKTSGLQRSDLILVAARPAMGKTAFALNVALNAALKGKGSVAVFSLEMSKDQLVQRMLSAESHVELQKIINGQLDEDDWPNLVRAMGPLSQAGIYIDDTPGITLMELKAKCRKLKIERGLDLIMIDYLQLMSGEGRVENRQQEISNISRGLKGLAKELDCPVVALSQLSRAPEMRSDHRPMLSDLRESGAIEQDADIVIFLYRDEYYNPDSDKQNIGEVIIAKHRNGPIGTVELVFIKRVQYFFSRQISLGGSFKLESFRGMKISLEPLKLIHVYEMKDWTRYENPLFHGYNFPDLDDYEIRKWFNAKTGEKNCITFSIVLNDSRKTIGIISIKDIRNLLKVASLGISFDSKHINKGYGTDAIKILLRYYFEVMRMRIIYLDVAKHNNRAMNCYKKCGFKKVKEYIMKDEEIEIEDININDVENYFTFKNNRLYLYCYRMKLTKNDYGEMLYTK